MRTAAIAFGCLMSFVAATCGAAEPAVPPTSGAAKPHAISEAHASLPDAKPRSRGEGLLPPRGRVCFNQAETRDKIASHRLSDPLRALRLGRQQGEALSAKLCRWTADVFVYEIHVLRRDGRVVHVYMDAQSGETVGGPAGSGQPGVERAQDRNGGVEGAPVGR